ncbi:hypothetical protein LWI28_018254 [Acer negundo]|uniref:Peroxisomal membrane protein PEX14 n=1 Tax=Acer negundo TaxID=4023 RepID=A0AAD5IM67_ACENE|nr:hypothetical protein LWI28_018254 [Acer negundo]
MGIESTAPSKFSDDEKPNTPQHVIENPEPMREELVQMAVKFLSHATVRNSPIDSRRTFLEKKGLTTEEIDEAFRRVPDSPPNVIVGQSHTANQDVQSKEHPPTASLIGVISTLATSPPSRFYWSHAFFVVGLLTASFAGTAILLKKFFLPRLKSWIRKVVLEEHDGSARKSKSSLFEEVTAAAKTASIAATNAAKSSMEMLNSKYEERQYFEALIKSMNFQVAEMRSMSKAIKNLEGTGEAAPSSYKQLDKYIQHLSRNGPNNTPRESTLFDCEDPISYLESSMKVKANDVSKFGSSVRPSSAPASTRPVGQHPKSYMEIMAMIQRGEIPPGIKEIDDSPPNPDQPLPNPHMAPRSKPWEVAQPYNNGTHAQNIGTTSKLNGDAVVPWWHRKNARTLESEPANGTTTYINDAMTDERQPQHPWMHSQPSSISMSKAVDVESQFILINNRCFRAQSLNQFNKRESIIVSRCTGLLKKKKHINLAMIQDLKKSAALVIQYANVSVSLVILEPSTSKVLQDVHISARLMEDFLDLAKENTDKDLETCGVLGAFLENNTFYVTTLIIPKQDSTSSSCQAINEEDVFTIQNERSLFPVGWIHTHPSQSCFMSSVDLHTHFSYQVMVPEAFAIVVAPTDSSRSNGIFRLTDPGGMSILKECQETGFHPHKETADGSPIYEHCSNVYKNSNLRFEIFDLR